MYEQICVQLRKLRGLKNFALESRIDLPIFGVRDKMNNKIKLPQQTSKTRCLYVEKIYSKA